MRCVAFGENRAALRLGDVEPGSVRECFAASPDSFCQHDRPVECGAVDAIGLAGVGVHRLGRIPDVGGIGQ